MEWAADNKTLFYTTEDAVTKRPDTLFRHTLGDKESTKLYREDDELYDIGIGKTRDKKFLLLEIESKDTTEFRYLHASEPGQSFAVVLSREKKHRYYVDHRENQFFIRTNRSNDGKELKDFQVVTAPDTMPGRENWRTFVPHTPGTLIEDVEPFKDFLVVVDKTEALNRLRIYQFGESKWSEIHFPEPVYAASPGANPEYVTDTFRYNYQSLTTPPSVFDYFVNAGRGTLLKRQEVPVAMIRANTLRSGSGLRRVTARRCLSRLSTRRVFRATVRARCSCTHMVPMGSACRLRFPVQGSRFLIGEWLTPLRTFAEATRWESNGAKTAC